MKLEQPCYETVEIDGDRLTITARQQNGLAIDTYTIDKGNHPANTITALPSRYNKTRVAICGSLLNGQTIKRPAVSTNTNGEWLVEANAFMAYLGGFASSVNGRTVLNLGGRTYEVPAAQTVINAKNVITISADAIRATLGFSCQYDESLNILFFVKMQNDD